MALPIPVEPFIFGAGCIAGYISERATYLLNNFRIDNKIRNSTLSPGLTKLIVEKNDCMHATKCMDAVVFSFNNIVLLDRLNSLSENNSLSAVFQVGIDLGYIQAMKHTYNTGIVEGIKRNLGKIKHLK